MITPPIFGGLYRCIGMKCVMLFMATTPLLLLIGVAEATPNNMTILYMPVYFNDTINFTQTHEPTITAEEQLDGWFDVPDRLFIVWTSCGEDVHAVYGSIVGTIGLCYEAVKYLYQTWDIDEVGIRGQNQTSYTTTNLKMIFLHELGHAVIKEWDLGEEFRMTDAEYYADTFMLYMVLRDITPEDALALRSIWSMFMYYLEEDYYDSLFGLRYDELNCAIYGKYPELYDEPPPFLPVDHRSYCDSLYDDIVQTWDTVLEHRQLHYKWNP